MNVWKLYLKLKSGEIGLSNNNDLFILLLDFKQPFNNVNRQKVKEALDDLAEVSDLLTMVWTDAKIMKTINLVTYFTSTKKMDYSQYSSWLFYTFSSSIFTNWVPYSGNHLKYLFILMT